MLVLSARTSLHAARTPPARYTGRGGRAPRPFERAWAHARAPAAPAGVYPHTGSAHLRKPRARSSVDRALASGAYRPVPYQPHRAL